MEGGGAEEVVVIRRDDDGDGEYMERFFIGGNLEANTCEGTSKVVF